MTEIGVESKISIKTQFKFSFMILMFVEQLAGRERDAEWEQNTAHISLHVASQTFLIHYKGLQEISAIVT